MRGAFARRTIDGMRIVRESDHGDHKPPPADITAILGFGRSIVSPPVRPVPFDGSYIPGHEGDVPALSPLGRALLDLWLEARRTWAPPVRVMIPEAMLLTALYRSADEGLAVLTDLSAQLPAARVSNAIREIRDVFTDVSLEVPAIAAAWDEAAACPFCRGLLPLSSIRTDLPLLEKYGLLDPASRLVLLAFSNEAGHRAVLSDGGVLAHRTGLKVAQVHVALVALANAGWIHSQAALAPRVFTATPGLFLPIPRGPWGLGQ